MLGVPEEKVAGALAAVVPTEMRMTRQAVGALTVVNDAYNANPDAVLASLRAFAELAADATRRVSVLGDMLELGDGAPAMHAEVGRAAAASGVGLAVFVGELSAHGAAAAREAGGCDVLHVPALDEQGVAAIAERLRAGDEILLKGSRGSRMERLAAALASRKEGAVPAR
jgi:UDP-N-acetylmuramoyl-tripeptide--D-alanyl-D-alanine ligase